MVVNNGGMRHLTICTKIAGWRKGNYVELTFIALL